MSGNLSIPIIVQPTLKQSKAYAEGRSAKVKGLPTKVKGVWTNPHPPNSADWEAWELGYDTQKSSGSAKVRDHCADIPIA